MGVKPKTQAQKTKVINKQTKEKKQGWHFIPLRWSWRGGQKKPFTNLHEEKEIKNQTANNMPFVTVKKDENLKTE